LTLAETDNSHGLINKSARGRKKPIDSSQMLAEARKIQIVRSQNITKKENTKGLITEYIKEGKFQWFDNRG